MSRGVGGRSLQSSRACSHSLGVHLVEHYRSYRAVLPDQEAW